MCDSESTASLGFYNENSAGMKQVRHELDCEIVAVVKIGDDIFE